MLSAVLTIDGPVAAAAAEAIAPESGRELPRTRTQVGTMSDRTVVRIEAEDASAMRAAVNSYLECIAVVQSVERIAKVRQ